MKKRVLTRIGFVTLAALTAGPSVAQATQPLQDFLSAAKTKNYSLREQRATKEQRDWEQDAALGRILPSFTARGIYTRNQFEIAPAFGAGGGRLVITPLDQLDGLLQLDVPLIDLANYARYRQAKHLNEAADIQTELAGNEVDLAVSRAYYNFLGASALYEAASRTLRMAEENARFVTTRREGGAATDLDLERAKANVEQAKQNQADADLARALAARQMETLSGINPTPAQSYPEDDLHDEGSLEGWIAARDTPNDRLQAKTEEAVESGKRAGAYALLPTLSANAQERLTNATGFTGRNGVYALQAVLQWRFDYGTYATAQAQAAANGIQNIRVERARRDQDDAIFQAHRRVGTGIAKSKSARAQATAAKKAAELAQDRYQAGASTQLDVTQAQRDMFFADANRIQADADLAYARASLRVTAGKPLSGPQDVGRAASSQTSSEGK
jgi:outer membrane protein TolC